MEENKIAKYGRFSISVYKGICTYKFKNRTRLDDYQNCIIDNIWNVLTDVHAMHKRKVIIGVLVDYFTKQSTQPQNKRFLYYVIYSDSKCGIYSTWAEAKLSIEKSVNASWARAYNLESAQRYKKST